MPESESLVLKAVRDALRTILKIRTAFQFMSWIIFSFCILVGSVFLARLYVPDNLFRFAVLGLSSALVFIITWMFINVIREIPSEKRTIYLLVILAYSALVFPWTFHLVFKFHSLRTIHGHVFDTDNGHPIEGALVSSETLFEVETDESGYFRASFIDYSEKKDSYIDVKHADYVPHHCNYLIFTETKPLRIELGKPKVDPPDLQLGEGIPQEWAPWLKEWVQRRPWKKGVGSRSLQLRGSYTGQILPVGENGLYQFAGGNLTFEIAGKPCTSNGNTLSIPPSEFAGNTQVALTNWIESQRRKILIKKRDAILGILTSCMESL